MGTKLAFAFESPVLSHQWIGSHDWLSQKEARQQRTGRRPNTRLRGSPPTTHPKQLVYLMKLQEFNNKNTNTKHRIGLREGENQPGSRIYETFIVLIIQEPSKRNFSQIHRIRQIVCGKLGSNIQSGLKSSGTWGKRKRVSGDCETKRQRMSLV